AAARQSLGLKGLAQKDMSELGLKTGAFANVVGTMSGGAIIERGSNANGEYVKYADGTQICYLPWGAVSSPALSAYGVAFSADLNWTFPKPFLAPPAVSGSFQPLSSRGWLSASSVSKTMAVLTLWAAYNEGAGSDQSVMAIGRWG
ncbi:hypothetical protein ACFONF_16570, partial [Alcaligenes endophyticus]